MTSFLFTSGEHAVQTLSVGQTGLLGRDAIIASGADVGVYTTASGVRLRVEGQILIDSNSGILLFGNGNSVEIGETGIVASSASTSSLAAGIALFGGFTADFVNFGQVSGGGIGAYLAPVAGGLYRATNAGTITGGYNGVEAINSGAVQLNNSGHIVGSVSGVSNIHNLTSYDPILKITNTGTIQGYLYSVHCGNVGDSIVNRGTLNGDVYLGDGADYFDNRGGLVIGTIDGGAGADTFRPGTSEEVILGGAGPDTLNFSSAASGISVALDGGFENSGLAAGDSYASIEILRGSATGADVLRGASAAETLWGNGGNDKLYGMAGIDALIGAAGKDVLSGGAGNDHFIFYKAAEGGDMITDFGNVVGNDDNFFIKATGFGAGLVAGALAASQFILRTDNLAQDANDHFIFRSTDKTLWFDVNGSAAGGLTLIADLQNTAANLTAGDIILI